MSNIEKICQEIERLKKENRNIRCQYNEKYCIGYDDAFNDLLIFVDSLPECEETTKIPTEKYEEELNEEIQGFIDEYGYERGEDKILIAIVARHFAEWQKEQMTKNAVEGEIGYWNQTGLSIRLDQSLEKLGYGEDTEVKVIIVKQ